MSRQVRRRASQGQRWAVRGRQRPSRGYRCFSALAQNHGAPKKTLTTGMRTVLRSDFVNRNKVVIPYITFELRYPNPLLVDFWLASEATRKFDMDRETTVMCVAESRSVSNIWIEEIKKCKRAV